MLKLKLTSGRKLIKLLLKVGFEVSHQKGSHIFLAKAGKIITVPVHSNKDLGRGLILKILKDAKISKGFYENKI